jgi:hypothetical protein
MSNLLVWSSSRTSTAYNTPVSIGIVFGFWVKIITPSDIEALADLHASMNDVVRAIESEESPLGDD